MSKSPRQWRLDRGLTLFAAARLVGVAGRNPARTWQRWETGELEPPLNVVSTISEKSEGLVTLDSWRDVRSARFSAVCTPTLGETAGRESAASADPNPESLESPQPVHGLGDRIVVPVSDGPA